MISTFWPFHRKKRSNNLSSLQLYKHFKTLQHLINFSSKMFLKSSLVLSILVATLVSATPVVGDYSGLGLGVGLDSSLAGGQGGLGGPGDLGDLGSSSCSTGDCSTTVPVAPISIVPETDFVPINNVLPIVNILPVDVNDYSFLNDDLYGDYGFGGYGGYGNYGYGYGGIGGLGGLGSLGGLGGLGLGGGGIGGLGGIGEGGVGGLGLRGLGGIGGLGGLGVIGDLGLGGF
ncbi:MAG: hypothetical protein BYD32DRAFT_427394 [Podila humilis]|nr:MAG: hypothetical protein BYD32DRAFT_427394 [Podila humilis]